MTNNHKITTVILDLGNVFVDFDHRIAAKKISKFTDKTEEKIFNLFFDSWLTALFEEGKIAPEAFFLKIKETLNLRLDYQAFVPIWNEIFFLTKKNRAVHSLAKGLKRNYRLALLSNINILHFDYLKKRFPVFDVFHHLFTSYELGVRKPHPLIYQKVLNLLGVLPENVFYADDRPELAQSAKKLGIRGFIFKDTIQLKSDLENLGIFSSA